MRTVSGFFPFRLFIYLFYLFPICFTGKGGTAAASLRVSAELSAVNAA